MAYQNIAEIFDSIDDTRQRLTDVLASLDEPRRNFRTSPEAWSVAEIVEHLSIIEHQLARLTGMMVAKAEAAGMLRAPTDEQPPELFSIDAFVEQSKSEKYIAPENIRPSGNLPLAESLERLRRSRATLHSLRPRLEQINGASLQYPHPVFGPLNIYQWLAFIGAHEARHLRQIQTLLSETTNGKD